MVNDWANPAIQRCCVLRVLLGHMRRLLAALLALPCPARAASPAALNVQLGDLPRDFLGIDQDLSLADAAKADHVGVADARRAGRLSTNEVNYSGVVLNGMSIIDSTVGAFATPAGARAIFARLVGYLGARPGARPLAIGAVGDRRAAWTTRQGDAAHPLTKDSAVFVRGPYLVEQYLIYTTWTVPHEKTAHFARLVDGRIRHAG